jgi:hypothetical protein
MAATASFRALADFSFWWSTPQRGKNKNSVAHVIFVADLILLVIFTLCAIRRQSVLRLCLMSGAAKLPLPMLKNEMSRFRRVSQKEPFWDGGLSHLAENALSVEMSSTPREVPFEETIPEIN